MPNWCANRLEVIGSAPNVEKFITVFGNPPRFAALYPVPEEGMERLDWRIANWGTKWDIDDDSTIVNTDSPNRVVYTFDTVWSPPIEWVEKVSKDFPQLFFRLLYAEPGMEFSGNSEWGDWAILQTDGIDYLYDTLSPSALMYGWIHSNRDS